MGRDYKITCDVRRRVGEREGFHGVEINEKQKSLGQNICGGQQVGMEKKMRAQQQN